MLKTYDNIRVDFFDCGVYWLSLGTSLTWLEKLGIYLQISNELHNDISRYRQYSFGQIDPYYCETLMISTKNNVQIAYAQLIELTL